MKAAVGLCGFCGLPLDESGSRTCDCARARRVVLGLLETVRRAACLTHRLAPRQGATTVTHLSRAIRVVSERSV